MRDSFKFPRVPDICGFCGRKLRCPDDVAWRGMASDEGIHAASNYCRPSKADRLDPDKKGKRSECEVMGGHNQTAVVGRLKKFKANNYKVGAS